MKKHLATKMDKGRYLRPLCGADKEDGQIYVQAALESDCDDCRIAVNVARVGDKSWDGRTFGVKEHPAYERRPALRGADGKIYERKKP